MHKIEKYKTVYSLTIVEKGAHLRKLWYIYHTTYVWYQLVMYDEVWRITHMVRISLFNYYIYDKLVYGSSKEVPFHTFGGYLFHISL
jgi:hypothetical protein